MYSAENLLEKQQNLLNGRQMFDVEITTNCNKHCYICPRDKFMRTGRVMTQATFDALCAWLPADCDVFFAGFGEPLLHEQCANFVRQLHDSGRGTSIMTNGTLLTAEKTSQLFNAGLDKLQISILQKDELSLLAHFTNLIPHEYKSRVVFNIIKEENMEETKEAMETLRLDSWRFCIKQVHNRAGLLFSAEHTAELQTCATFFCDTYISAGGAIQVCSSDINGKHNIGSIFQMSFDEILLFKKHFLGNKEICPLCKNCTDEYRLKHFKETQL